MSEDTSLYYQRSKLKTVSKTLNDYFTKNEGIIMGSSSVVSMKVHFEPRDSEGTVFIDPTRDAGITYLKLIEKNQAVHIDIFHNPAEINILDLSNRIRITLSAYLEIVQDTQDISRPDSEILIMNLSQRIFLKTAGGEGTVLNPLVYHTKPGGSLASHVHILAKIPEKYYGLVYYIIDQTEKAIAYQGHRLRQVMKIIHLPEEADDENFPLGVPINSSDTEPPLEVKLQNLTQILLSVARELGGLEIAESFLELISPLKAVSLARFGKRYPCMDNILHDLAQLDYVKKEAIGYALTKKGQELKTFLGTHRKGLTTQIRKAIRQVPPTPGITPAGHFCNLRSKHRELFDKRKTIERDPDNWYNPIAIPDTVLKAARRKVLEGNPKLAFKEADLMVFKRKSKAPVDICMVVDCSGSMKGAKLQAVRWVAEYLVLTTRDKVALVSFQERDAQVIVPFTRSYSILHESLLSLTPEGLTPLAKGLRTALELIKESRPRNPMLALITDGKPNTPLFSNDPVADAVQICRDFPSLKIRFVIIGIDPAKEFIPKLAEAGKGNFYLVDDIDRSNLITIIRSERKSSDSIKYK